MHTCHVSVRALPGGNKKAGGSVGEGGRRWYNLLRHPNIRFTEDGGAPPYDYTAAPDAHEDLAGDAENYELLDMDDFLPAAEQPKPMFTYPRRDAHASQQD